MSFRSINRRYGYRTVASIPPKPAGVSEKTAYGRDGSSFVPYDGSDVLRSQRETTQPTLADLEYWATGITAVYLEGALERTLTPPPLVVEPPVVQSVYDEPAPREPLLTNVDAPETGAVLNPFSVYAKGEQLLRQQLAALAPWHLRTITVAYELADPSDVDLDALTAAELVELIVGAVRGRLAA